ncbi:MAG TPA: PAS domain S-box protein, partial [Alphaproteobacteria bacterium]|nr:PAS domain S-box protein [Alphaproteobacteria bacterium]
MPENSEFSAERLKVALELARAGLWERDVRSGKVRRTPMVDEMFGFKPGEAGDNAAPFLARIHPDDLAAMARSFQRVLAPGTYYQMDFRVNRGDGALRWIAGRAEVIRGEGGQPIRVLSVLRDVTERKLTEEALRDALDHSTEILESISDAFFALGPDFTFTYANHRALEMWGRRAEEVIGRKLLEVFPQATGTPVHSAYLDAMRRRETVHLETISPVISRWLSVTIYPSRGGGLSVYFQDIEERKKGEERMRLLAAEVDHRAKNMLSLVNVMLRQTRAATVQEFATAAQGRVAALARAHTLLSDTRWEGADLGKLIREELAPFRLGKSGRITAEGERLALSPAAAQAFAMAVHELATNAGKYGALSAPEVTVSVNWTLSGPDLLLTWRESGGPRVRASGESGFGLRVITLAIRDQLGGKASFDWRPEGLRVELAVP